MVPDTAALREVLGRRDAWSELLEAGHEHDPELYAAWVPEQGDRELNRASIYNRDLGQATAYLGGAARRPITAAAGEPGGGRTTRRRPLRRTASGCAATSALCDQGRQQAVTQPVPSLLCVERRSWFRSQATTI